MTKRGFTQVATSTPDGYRILLTNGSLGAIPTLYRNLSVDLADLTPAGLFYEVPMVLAGAPGLPVSNPGELRGWLQANQGSARMAHSSLTSASYLCALQYLAASQVTIAKVPYAGSGPATVDLLGNQVSLLCETSTLMAPFVEDSKAKGLGVTSGARLGEGLSQVPTFAELGLPNMQISDWYGVYAPKGTPAPIVNRINDSIRKAMQDPAYIARQGLMRGLHVTDNRLTPAGHKAFVEAEAARWAPLIQAAGQYAD